jgi:hypothetical protein
MTPSSLRQLLGVSMLPESEVARELAFNGRPVLQHSSNTMPESHSVNSGMDIDGN